MKTLLSIITILFFSFSLSSCIQQDIEESEFTVQANGRIFERSERRGLTSSGKSTNDVQKDFNNLIKKYEPPIISPTPDKNVKGRIILKRDLILRAGQLNTIEEAIYPAGFKTECFQELLSNGFLWMPVNTNEYEIETNGDISGNIDKKGTVLIKWQTNFTTLWFKKKSTSKRGVDLLKLYEKHLDDN